MSLTTEGKSHLRHVRLNLWEVKMVNHIAQNGGEVRFDFRNVQIAVRKAFVELNRKGVLDISPHDGYGILDIPSIPQYPIIAKVRLSDQGRAIMDHLNAATVGKSDG